jgi:uncharacterized membrane protein
MVALIIILLLAILTVQIILLSSYKPSYNLFDQVMRKINMLSEQVDRLGESQKEEVVEKNVPEEEDVSINESLLTLMEALPKEEEPKVEKVEEVVQPKVEVVKPVEPVKKQPVIVPPRPQKAAFTAPKKKKKRDIEKFIGENLINKIGIGVLVLGIAYFVRYAIDKDWISEVGRVAIGILSGGILSFFAHKIRKSFKAFSSVLVGGALAVFYYTISIGFHEYELFSQSVAFALMVIITGFSVLLSVSYDRKELAILALVGAFSTPLMVSNGSGNYLVLFSYLAIVNVGMLVLAYFRKWNIVNVLSFAFTTILYVAWFADNIIDGVNPHYQGAMIFAAIFYVIFFLMHILNNVKEGRKFKGYEFGLMLCTTGLFYAVGMSVLYLSNHQNYQGLFTVGLGLFNLVFALPLYKKGRTNKSLLYLWHRFNYLVIILPCFG